MWFWNQCWLKKCLKQLTVALMSWNSLVYLLHWTHCWANQYGRWSPSPNPYPPKCSFPNLWPKWCSTQTNTRFLLIVALFPEWTTVMYPYSEGTFQLIVRAKFLHLQHLNFIVLCPISTIYTQIWRSSMELGSLSNPNSFLVNSFEPINALVQWSWYLKRVEFTVNK